MGVNWQKRHGRTAITDVKPELGSVQSNNVGATVSDMSISGPPDRQSGGGVRRLD
jgi:hypothetical protein